MRLVTFIIRDNGQDSGQDSRPRPGIWSEDGSYILDIAKAGQRWPGATPLPATMRALIEQQEHALPLLRALAQKDADEGAASGCRIPFAAAALRAPYTDPPRNILCTGINYTEHLKELDRGVVAEQKMPEHPFIFTKPRTCIAHPDTAVDCHCAESQAYDYEVELAVIIGKTGKNIRREEALEHIFGYSIINDMSARDLQRLTTQWYRGKALDESAPFGPCIVTRDAIPDPQQLHISSKINGELRQNAHTSQMIFDLPTLISTLSLGSTLEAGDIIATGTPAGVGMSFKPPRYLKPGDLMELEIEGIGVLRNTLR